MIDLKSVVAQDGRDVDLTSLGAGIVSAYVSKNAVSATDVSALIRTVHKALAELGSSAGVAPEELKPPVSIRRSITPDYLISMEDGQKYKLLKRHLAIRGLTPDQYRLKWGLPADYPMVATNYAARRSQLAKEFGLGRPGPKRKPTKRR